MRNTIIIISVALCMVWFLNIQDKKTIYIEDNSMIYIDQSPKYLIRELFGDDANTAIAICYAESNFNPDALGDKHLMYSNDGKMYGDSIGLFQIRTFPNRPPRELLYDPYINIKMAHKIYKKYGFNAWSSYKNKSYKKFLPVLKPEKIKVKA